MCMPVQALFFQNKYHLFFLRFFFSINIFVLYYYLVILSFLALAKITHSNVNVVRINGNVKLFFLFHISLILFMNSFYNWVSVSRLGRLHLWWSTRTFLVALLIDCITLILFCSVWSNTVVIYNSRDAGLADCMPRSVRILRPYMTGQGDELARC